MQESVYFIRIVETANEAILFRTLYFICRIGVNEINLHSVLQSLVDVRVIVDNRRSADTLKLFQVKLLNVFRRQVFKGDFLLAEVRRDDFLD